MISESQSWGSRTIIVAANIITVALAATKELSTESLRGLFGRNH